jgi:hypothetical protein
VRRLFEKWLAKAPVGENQAEALLIAETGLQQARLELADCEQAAASLRQENERLQVQASQVANASCKEELERLFSDLAGPLSILATLSQRFALDPQTGAAKDVLQAAVQAVQAASAHGVTISGKIGERVGYDPSRHIPFGNSPPPQIDELVVLRSVSVQYQGKVLRKAIVEREM